MEKEKRVDAVCGVVDPGGAQYKILRNSGGLERISNPIDPLRDFPSTQSLSRAVAQARNEEEEEKKLRHGQRNVYDKCRFRFLTKISSLKLRSPDLVIDVANGRSGTKSLRQPTAGFVDLPAPLVFEAGDSLEREGDAKLVSSIASARKRKKKKETGVQ